MNKKIYIAGKVTGEHIPHCIIKFQRAQMELEAAGFEAINPLEVVGTWNITWEGAMRKCIKALMDCDAVYMLPCCAKSKGARLETRLASEFKIPIFNNLDQWKSNSQPTQ